MQNTSKCSLEESHVWYSGKCGVVCVAHFIFFLTVAKKVKKAFSFSCKNYQCITLKENDIQMRYLMDTTIMLPLKMKCVMVCD